MNLYICQLGQFRRNGSVIDGLTSEIVLTAYLPNCQSGYLNSNPQASHSQMINARIQPNLIHNRNPRLLYFLLQLHHRRTNIARRDHILLLPNRRFDDRRMESVWDQVDHYIVLLDLSVKASESVTSREMGWARLMPLLSFFEDSRVRHAGR
jgi:hypothetical protein